MPVLANARHERFAQELAKGKSADEAYQAAGFSANRGNAVRLKANENVRARLAELQAKAADRAVVTVEDIARQLDEDREFARTNGAAAAMVSATMGKAKVLGLIVERSELTGKDGGPLVTDNAHHGEVAVSDTVAFVTEALGSRATPAPGKPRTH